MKNYYDILGVPVSAREEDIKRSFRKLALQYHPDKNPSPQAEIFFKELNEAYEVLGDTNSRSIYDALLADQLAPLEATTRPHRDPRYHRRPPGAYRPGNSKKEQMRAMMTEYMDYATIVTKVALAFCMLLILDYSLPEKKTEQRIISMAKYGNRGSSNYTLQLETEDGNIIKLNKRETGEFTAGAFTTLYLSPWLSIPLRLENNGSHYQARVPVSIYGNFIFFPIILLLTALVGLIKWPAIEFRFNLGIVNFVLLMLAVVLLFVHNF